MKRLRVIACAAVTLMMLFMLTGCTYWLDDLLDGLEGSSASSVSFPVSSAVPTLPESKAASSSSVASLPDSSEAPAGEARTFVQVTDQTSSDYYPSLVLLPDGTFMLTVNLYEGMGHVWGNYTSSGQTIECTIAKRDFAGFAGDGETAFTMEIVDNSTLRIGGGAPGGMTEAGSVFTLDNQFPTDDPAMPDVLFSVSADGDGGLNLRSEAAVSSESYGLVPKGTVLEVYNMTKNYTDGEVWYQVRYDGKDGWVSAQYTIWLGDA